MRYETLADYNRAIIRRMWKRRAKAALTAFWNVLSFAFFLVTWICIWFATF